MKRLHPAITGSVFFLNLIPLILSFFPTGIALTLPVLISPISLTINAVFDSILIFKLSRSKKKLKMFINIGIHVLLFMALIFTLFNGFFDTLIYVIIPLCILSYFISFILEYLIKRHNSILDGEILPIYKKYQVNFCFSLICFNATFLFLALYIRIFKPIFAFGKYDKSFLDVLNLVMLIVLLILFVFSLFLLALGIIAKFNNSKKKLIITSSLILVLDGIFMFIVSIMTIVGSICFYPYGYDSKNIPESFKVEEVRIEDSKNCFTGLYRDNGKDKITLFFPGNAMSSYHAIDSLMGNLDNANTNVLAVDYPYFGGSKGRLNEKNLFHECDMFYEYITNELGYTKDKIIIAGFSIGTGMATYTASKHECLKLVLGAPYDNFTNVLNTYLNVFYPPISYTVEFKFKSDEYAKDVKCPVTIILVEDDYTVRPKLSRSLCECFNTDVKLIELEYGGHNSIPQSVAFHEEVLDIKINEE